MASDLEKFLQQAAERLAEKVKQGQQPSQRPVARQPSRGVRETERAPVEHLDPEIVDAVVLQPQRGLDVNPLSQLDTRRLETIVRKELAQSISQADERMASHVKHVTAGDVMHLRQASGALQGSNTISGSTDVKRRGRRVSPMVTMLRNPETLRAAFIASLIFNRRPG